MRFALLGTPLLCLSICLTCQAQNPQDASNTNSTIADRVLDFPGKLFNRVRGQADKMNKQLTAQTTKCLQQLMNEEARLKKKLYKVDSNKATAMFSGMDAQYKALMLKLQSTNTPVGSTTSGQYLAPLDSLHTSLSFLKNNPSYLSSASQIGSLNQSLASVQQLQGRFNQTNEIQQFIGQRQQFLRTQLSQFGFSKQLAGINKRAYYYQQQLQQYKNMLHDKDKLKQEALEELGKLPAYQAFMQKNSYLSRLFGLPADYGSATAAAGLQTKAMINQMISQVGGMKASGGTGGSGGQAGGSQFLQQQLESAQQSISQLQSKVTQLALPGASQSSLVMPDFQPNTQKTKSFLSRLEYGIDVQTQKSSILVPTTADIGLKLGYKFSDKSTAGVGASYKLGLGNGINHFALSNQGLGLQSYIDIKAKGSIWISGGVEYNYWQTFSELSQLRAIDAWQRSALIGITKKYKISAKQQGNLQLLFDMLYQQHIPVTQPILFRTGITF
jgi:hypothetical protein